MTIPSLRTRFESVVKFRYGRTASDSYFNPEMAYNNHGGISYPDTERTSNYSSMKARTTTPLKPLAVSPAEAAEMLGISRAHVYKLINHGVLRRSKIGSRTLILVADLEALIESATQ